MQWPFIYIDNNRDPKSLVEVIYMEYSQYNQRQDIFSPKKCLIFIVYEVIRRVTFTWALLWIVSICVWWWNVQYIPTNGSGVLCVDISSNTNFWDTTNNTTMRWCHKYWHFYQPSCTVSQTSMWHAPEPCGYSINAVDYFQSLYFTFLVSWVVPSVTESLSKPTT